MKKRLITSLSFSCLVACSSGSETPGNTLGETLSDTSTYEVWLSDQGNTQGISAASPTGTSGGRVVIYQEQDLMQSPPVDQPTIIDAGEMFSIAEAKTGGAVIRLHGMLPSPNHRYMAANFVGSGHLGVIDGETKKAVCLFRSTGTQDGRQNHMSFWSPNGEHLLVSNQNGRMLERIDVSYTASGVASSFVYNAAAGLDLVGGSNRIISQPVAVDMDPEDGISCEMMGQTQDNQPTTTPAGNPKQNESRPKNAPICPIPASNGKHAFTTLGGGGMFVIDYTTSPMAIVAEYDTSVMNSAGCGGAEYDGYMHLNTGTSGPGVSEFSMYRFPIAEFPAAPAFKTANEPAPLATWTDEKNQQVLEIGENRDAHGVAIVKPKTASNAFLHQFDRVQNTAEVFTMAAPWNTFQHASTYDLTESGACGTTLGAITTNDPAPDLAGVAPDGQRIYIALRGPKPLTVSHAAEGSCPGLGVIEISADGSKGSLKHVLPTQILNFDKDLNISDPHAVIVRPKVGQ